MPRKKEQEIPLSALRTVGAAVRAAAHAFAAAELTYGHGTFSAEEDAVFLVLETLHLPQEEGERFAAVRLTDREKKAVAAAVAARISTRKPAAYIVRKAYLQGFPFYVDERVIVPRSFIAELMAEGLSGVADFPLLPRRPPRRILDLCTGSGCLAVLAAHYFPGATVDAVELSMDAISVAARNIEDSPYRDRITLLAGDLFRPVKGRTYDLIISNPPYVAPPSMKRLPDEYRAEPVMALAGGGADGMDIVRRILDEAPRHLTCDGGLLCEIGQGKPALEKSLKHLPFLWLDTEESSGEVFWLSAGDFKNKS